MKQLAIILLLASASFAQNLGANTILFPQQSAPSNPPTGFSVVYYDSSLGTMKCLTSTGASCLSAGGGGSGNPVLTLFPFAFNPTPTFNAATGQLFTMTLTGNVTASTVIGGTLGEMIGFNICQDVTGGRTFAWPTNFNSPPPINQASSSCTTVLATYDGANWSTYQQATLVGSSIANGAALLTLPSSTDTLVGRATTDTLTNKTFGSAIPFSGISNASPPFSGIPSGAPVVSNLVSQYWGAAGNDPANPPVIGGTTPNAITATNLNVTGTATFSGSGGQNLQTTWQSMSRPNDAGTGTTVNLLAKLTSGNAIVATNTDTTGIVGVVVNGAGTTGSSEIAINGTASCVADNTWVAGDYLIPGTTTGGRCKSNGASVPTSGQIIGRALSACSAASSCSMLLKPDSLGSTAGFSGLNTNGAIYATGATTVASTATGGAGTLCLQSTAGAAPVWGACSGTAATAWDALTAPGSNLAISHAAKTTTFTWNNATGASTDLFNLLDTASNTGTGHVFNVHTASSSAAKPFVATAGGTANGVEIDTTGLLSAIGTGGINATQLGAKTFASPAAIGTGTPAAGTFTTLTANTGVVFSGTTAHGVVLSEGSSVAAVTAAGTTGQCLVGNTGADPGFASCPGGGGGSGTVTNTAGNLTANALMVGNGVNDSKVEPNVTDDGTTFTVAEVSTFKQMFGAFQVVNPQQFSGADACAQILTAISTIAGTQAIVVDARGYGNLDSTTITCAASPLPSTTNRAIVLVLGASTWTINAPWTGTSGLNHTYILGGGRGITRIKAGSTFPTTGASCITPTAGAGPTTVCPLIAVGLSNNNVFGSSVRDVELDCNSSANCFGIYSANAQEITDFQRLQISNTPGGCLYFDRASASASGASNYIVRDINCVPGAAGTASTVGAYYRSLGNSGGPAIIENITFQGNGTTMGAGIRLDGSGHGSLRHIHCEYTTDCIDYGPTLATHGIVALDISGSTHCTNLVHIESNATDGVFIGMHSQGACASVKDDVASLTVASNNQDLWAVGGMLDAGMGASYGIASDAGISRTGAATLAVGNGTRGDASGTLSANTLSLGGAVSSLGGTATTNNGVVGEFGSVGLSGQTANIGTTNLIAAASVTGGVYEVIYDLETTTGGAGTLTLTLGFTDRIGATTQTDTLALGSTGRKRGSFFLFASSSTNITYATSGYSSGTYAISLRAIKP